MDAAAAAPSLHAEHYQMLNNPATSWFVQRTLLCMKEHLDLSESAV
jgi:hypothetical protein